MSLDDRLALALTRHRGPFRFQLCRATPTRKSKFSTDTLAGCVEGTPDEIIAEARAYVDDPRDNIVSVAICSDTEQCHVVTITRKDAA